MMRPHTIEASPIANFDSKSISQTKSKSQGNPKVKDLSRDFKNAIFLDTIRKDEKQKKEQNNDSKNTITNNNATTQILISTNPYGSGNGGNNQFDRQTQEQSATIEKDGRINSTAHNGGFTQLLGEKDERSERLGEGNQNLEAGSRNLDERSEIIKEIYQRKAWLTNDELKHLNGLKATTKNINKS